MIKIVRIAGESFDLETHQEIPKALILSNGVRELALYVEDDIIKDVVEMMKETTTGAQIRTAGYEVPPGPQRLGKVEAPERPAPKPAARSPEPASPPPMAAIGEAPEPEVDDDNSGFEPGEEYNDPATGAESL